MIVAFLNHKGCVDKTPLALHAAEAWAAQSKRIVVDDTDSQGSALDRSEQRTKEGLPQLFDVLEVARDTLHVEAPEITRDGNHVVIDGSSHAAALMRSAMLAADLTLVSAQPSPFDGWASSETFRLLHEARLFRPPLIVRFVLNCCVARPRIVSEIAEALAKHDSPALGARVGQRIGFAEDACTGRLVLEMPRSEPAAREVAALVAEIERIAR
jgi:chromosome partitioning protein